MSNHDFGSYSQALQESQVPAWREFYYNYDFLAQLIGRCSNAQQREGKAAQVAQKQVMNGWSERSRKMPSSGASERVADESSPARGAELAVVGELKRQDEVVNSFFELTLNNLWAKAEPLFEQAEQLVRNDGGYPNGGANESWERASRGTDPSSRGGTEASDEWVE